MAKRVRTLNAALWRFYQGQFAKIDELEKALQPFIPFKDPKVASLHTYYVLSRTQLRAIISELHEKVMHEQKFHRRS